MIRKFMKDERGNYALMTAVALIPIMGALALSVDYAEIVRQKQETLNALDAAGIATARRLIEGATDAQATAYAKTFFEANLGHVDPRNTVLTVVLPSASAGGGTVKLTADLTYKPYFLPAAAMLIGKDPTSATNVDFSATSEVRLKNTLEVALVLDNSGSMDDKGTVGKTRMSLLKDASKQLVKTIADQASLMKQLDKPVQFALVPFAASVNVGSDNATKSWMDTEGLSPVQNENFEWSTIANQVLGANKDAVKTADNRWIAKGSDWGAKQQDKALTRFTLFNEMQIQTGTHQECTGSGSNRKCSYVADYSPAASWGGCVEARPYPYNVNDATPSTGTPATFFVPMFAPDEAGNKWTKSNGSVKTFGMLNSWWDDNDPSTKTDQNLQLARQKSVLKYFQKAPQGSVTIPSPIDGGPNYSCTTKAITPLTDVTTTAGLDTINTAIGSMASLGATDVPEGMAWGWRVLSNGEPFTGGRPETEKGNDKVVIVLTDGANTYYTPDYFGKNDYAKNRSSYSAYGYTGVGYNGGNTRMFLNTSSDVGKSTYTEANYTKAMNEQFATLCANAKANNILVMTIALDLNAKSEAESAQIAALKSCASDSRVRKEADGTPAKMFWNSTGSTLSDDFKAIANELSNLRIVS